MKTNPEGQRRGKVSQPEPGHQLPSEGMLFPHGTLLPWKQHGVPVCVHTAVVTQGTARETRIFSPIRLSCSNRMEFGLLFVV